MPIQYDMAEIFLFPYFLGQPYIFFTFLNVFFSIYIYSTWDLTVVAQANVMWEELSVSQTIGNGHYKNFSREAGASSFLKLSSLLQWKKAYALLIVFHYMFLLFYRSSNCDEQL